MDSRLLLDFGIEPEYIDIWGRTHATSEETARAILKSLCVTDLEGAAERHNLAQWSRGIPPTIVIREDADSILVHVPASRAGSSMKLEICWENGAGDGPAQVEHHWFWLPELATIESRNIAGAEFVCKRVLIPKNPRLGYHSLRLFWMREPELECFAHARFIVCPNHALAPESRMAGVALALYGLRSHRNWGIGDFTDLLTVIDAFADAGVQFIALNPLHAIPNRHPYNISPYLPTCSLYRNFIYLDVEKIIPGVAVPDVDSLRQAEFVQYEAIAKLKLDVLREYYRSAFASGAHAEDRAEFDRYAEREGRTLHDFAVYCALDEEMHRRDANVWLWKDWSAEYQDPHSDAVARFAREHSQAVSFFKFLQWQVDRQLAEAQTRAREKGMRIGLYHDLALATDQFGADVWANRHLYAFGARVGAPPDDFSPKGQDWSFPPPNREAHVADGYEWFARSIRNTARHGGALRIDHVMRFFRLYWIPDGMDATAGAYVRDHAENLLGILSLESHRENFFVIGEDLGTVTGEVRQALSESRVLSYRVLWFERRDDGGFREPNEYPAQAAVSTTTHDLPTLAGFAMGRDIEARREAHLLDDAAYHGRIASRAVEKEKLAEALEQAGFKDDPIGFLLSTPCALAIVNQEDLTGETEQQNLPATTWQHPNWQRKMKVAVEDLGAFAARLREWIERSGRR